MDYNDVIIRPVLSEKSTELSESKKYVFRVSLKANKHLIKKAVKEIFNVTAERVNVMIVRGKQKRVRHHMGLHRMEEGDSDAQRRREDRPFREPVTPTAANDRTGKLTWELRNLSRLPKQGATRRS